MDYRPYLLFISIATLAAGAPIGLRSKRSADASFPSCDVLVKNVPASKYSTYQHYYQAAADEPDFDFYDINITFILQMDSDSVVDGQQTFGVFLPTNLTHAEGVKTCNISSGATCELKYQYSPFVFTNAGNYKQTSLDEKLQVISGGEPVCYLDFILSKYTEAISYELELKNGTSDTYTLQVNNLKGYPDPTINSTLVCDGVPVQPLYRGGTFIIGLDELRLYKTCTVSVYNRLNTAPRSIDINVPKRTTTTPPPTSLPAVLTTKTTNTSLTLLEGFGVAGIVVMGLLVILGIAAISYKCYKGSLPDTTNGSVAPKGLSITIPPAVNNIAVNVPVTINANGEAEEPKEAYPTDDTDIPIHKPPDDQASTSSSGFDEQEMDGAPRINHLEDNNASPTPEEVRSQQPDEAQQGVSPPEPAQQGVSPPGPVPVSYPMPESESIPAPESQQGLLRVSQEEGGEGLDGQVCHPEDPEDPEHNRVIPPPQLHNNYTTINTDTDSSINSSNTFSGESSLSAQPEQQNRMDLLKPLEETDEGEST